MARNRLKRLVREAFRSLQAELGAVDIFVAPRRGLEVPTLEGIRKENHAIMLKLVARLVLAEVRAFQCERAE